MQCSLELKCVNSGPGEVSSSFWKGCNGKGCEAVTDTQETPPGDLAFPALDQGLEKRGFIPRSASKLTCDPGEGNPPISVSPLLLCNIGIICVVLLALLMKRTDKSLVLIIVIIIK